MQKQLPLQQLYQAQKTPQGPALSIAYSKKLNQYSTGHQNGQINIWDDKTNKILHKFTDHHGYVSRLQYDLSGKLYSGGKDGILRIWNFEKLQQKKKQPYRKLQLFSCQMIDLKINDRNKIIVMSSMNNQFVVYDFTGIKMIMSTRDQGKINAIAFDQKDRYMAIGGGEKYIATFKLQNQGNTITKSQELGQHPQTISSLAYQGESLLISVLKNGHIYIWNHMRVTLIKKIQNISPITCLSIYNKIFGCLSSEDGKIRIINLDQGKQVKVFKYKQPCLQFVTRFGSISNNNSKELPLMYAACKDGNIIKWNLNDLKKASQKSPSMLPMIVQQKKISKFGRKTLNENGTVMAQVEGQKLIKIKNLHEHTQQLIKIQKCPSPIEGLQFIQSRSHQSSTNIHQTLTLLLKSGQFWSLKSNSVYQPSTNDSQGSDILNQGNQEGDLYYSKLRETLFFRSGIKKVSKQIKRPSQLVVDEVTIGG